MSDLISRQAVIDRINKLIEVEKKQGTDEWGYGRERVNAYEAMLHFVKSEYLYPSVEPEKCSDCISRQAAEQPEKRTEERTESHACDCISREAAIQAVTHFDDTLKRLYELPSVNPERKTGKWIERPFKNLMFGRLFECDCCNKLNGLEDDFCPHCGAKMEVGG